MPRRTILTEHQRQQLFGLPVDDFSLRRHYVLSDADMKHIGTRRRPANRLGYALQICVLRYPARLLIVPGPTTVERLCADALVAAENRICQRIAERIEPTKRIALTELLAEVTEQGMTLFVWLRQHEPDNTSRVANALLDRLERIDAIGIEKGSIADIPVHRVARLRRQGERYFADGMRDLPEHRRLAILAVCCLEWQAAISDSIVETHDRIVGKLYRVSERTRDDQVTEQRGLIQSTVQAFADIGASLVSAKGKGESLEAVIEKGCG